MSTPEFIQAFPSEGGEQSGLHPSRGMSLRAYIATQAMGGLLHGSGYGAELHRIFDTDNRISNAGHPKESPQTYTARIALSLADALLTELNR